MVLLTVRENAEINSIKKKERYEFIYKNDRSRFCHF